MLLCFRLGHHLPGGHGQLVTPEGTVELSPGTSVYVPIGLHHATVCNGPEPLELISVFVPPVVPGSYEAQTQTEPPNETATS